MRRAPATGDPWRRLRRTVTSVVIATGTVLALTGAASGDPAGDDSSRRSLQLAYDGDRVVQLEDHPAAHMIDRDTMTLMATEHIPEFGGAYVDAETGALHVWLTKPTQQRGRDVQAALARAGESSATAANSLVIHSADYSFAQLAAWKDAAMALLLCRKSSC